MSFNGWKNYQTSVFWDYIISEHNELEEEFYRKLAGECHNNITELARLIEADIKKINPMYQVFMPKYLTWQLKKSILIKLQKQL